jgi:hypothetical protein
MTKTNRAAEFLANMNRDLPPPGNAQPALSPTPTGKSAKQSTGGRAGLKHIGGYFEMETVEKVAVLRARLRLDNSELIKLAIDDLHRKHMAKRAFGDA